MPLPGLAELQGYRPPRRAPGEKDSLLPSLAELAGPPLAVIGAVGDILTRPAYGISEAYGEAAEGGGATDVLEGLLRGVKGGYKEAEFPTFGERAFPEQEDEGFGRKVARFGVDVVTDPTVLFGGPAFRAAGKGALAAGRLVKGTKAAKRFADTDIAQSMSRAMFGTDYNVATFGERIGFKGGGKEAVERAARGAEEFRELKELRQFNIAEKIKQLGVDVNDEVFMKEVTAAIRGGKIFEPTKQSMFARVLREGYDELGGKISSFKDDFDDVFETFDTATGKSVPFKRIANYDPQFLKSEIAERLTTSRGISDATRGLMERHGLTRGQADNIINFETGNMKKAGNIEYARVSTDADVFEQNALKNYLRYVDQVEHRVAMARQFGIKGGKLKELMQGAEDAGLARKTVQTFQKGINRRFEPTPLAGIAPTLLGLQVMTKLGPTSVVNQMGQHANNIVVQGIGNYVKSWGKLIARDPETAQRAAMAVKGGLQAQMTQLFSELGAAGAGGIVPKLGSKYLGAIGFKFFDALPRRLAAIGGVPTAEQAVARAIKKGTGWTDDLAELSVTKMDFDYFAKIGKLPPSSETRIGLKASKLTQFEPDFLSLPPMWQSPEMRVVMQFRSFINEQTRFLWQGVMKPAIKYFDSNGAQGNIKPLMRALVMYPVAGQGVAAARELIKELSARAIGAKRNKRYKRKFDYDHPLAQIARDSLYVGAFGIGGDILEQASRGNLMSWAMGPTLGDVAGFVEGGIGTMGGMLEGEFPGLQDVAEFGARNVPGRRLLPLTPKELTTASTRRGLPKSLLEGFE